MKNITVLCLMLFFLVSSLPYIITQTVKAGVFYRSADRRMPHVISTHMVESASECCVTCLDNENCQSANYNNVTGSCQLAPQSSIAVSLLSLSDSSWNVYSKHEWLLVFVGLAGNGVDVYESYVSGTSTVTDDVNCMTLNMAACQQNYRSPVMDSWSSLSITEVKYSLYKNGQEVAYAMFNGTGSDVTNWFSKERLSNSSWTQALMNISFNFFSMEGDAPRRRFFISVSYNTCMGDNAFTLAVTSSAFFGCNYDSYSVYPQFIYSTTTSSAYFESGTDMGFANYMAIFIK